MCMVHSLQALVLISAHNRVIEQIMNPSETNSVLETTLLVLLSAYIPQGK